MNNTNCVHFTHSKLKTQNMIYRIKLINHGILFILVSLLLFACTGQTGSRNRANPKDTTDYSNHERNKAELEKLLAQDNERLEARFFEDIETAQELKKLENENLLQQAFTEENLRKIQQELQDYPQFKGESVMLYGSLHFFLSDGLRIIAEVQDPGIPKNVDKYEYRDGKWMQNGPVKLRDANLNGELIPMNKIDFALAHKVVKHAEDKTRDAEGIEPITSVILYRAARKTLRR